MRSGDYDYIVVGAGSAGCIVANRLSTDPETRVLLIEAGGSDRNFWLRLPVGFFRTIYDDRFSRVFETEPSDGVAGRVIKWPRGRIVGGSSSINGLIFIRGQREDFDDWERLGAAGWNADAVMPHFRRIERYDGPESQHRGSLGELSVSRLRNDNPVCRAWLDAAQQWGLPRNDDFNGETTYGVGSYQLSISKRWRASSANAFLHPIRSRPNLTLLTHTLTTRVTFEGDHATGVELVRNGARELVRATREVILCAGALQSPQLLQLSGIGAADHLRSLGIAPIVDLPGVGENLQDHYQARLLIELRVPGSLNDDIRNPVKLARMGFDWLVHGRGPLTVGAGQVGGGAMTKFATAGRPDIQFNVMPLSVDKPGEPLHRYSGFTSAFWQCHPRSRGHLRIRSADPREQPMIAPNYLSDPHDAKVMVEGVKIAREILGQPAFRSAWRREVLPGDTARTDAEILDFVRRAGGTVFHCCGTCRMGSDAGAVVDPQLKVRGVTGLRVADASVMPTVPSANTNAPTMMIADRAAALILGQA